VPARIAQFAAKQADANGSAGPEEPTPAPMRKPPRPKPSADQRYVRRGYGFQRMEEQELVPGEHLYARKAGSPAFVRVGRVSVASTG
jgi:hypothetical protein